MTKTSNVALLLVISLLRFSIAYGQSAIPASGGNVKGDGGSVSFTAGQVIYDNYFSANGNVAQGVQQPFEISTVTAIKDAKNIILEYIVYPNPTQGLITLTVKPLDDGKMRYRLFDINGLLLQDKKIDGEKTYISINELPTAVYFLEIIIENQEVKVFKIIKN